MLCEFGLKMPIHGPFGGSFEVKVGKVETLCSFIPLGIQLPWNWHPINQTA